ncbi:hypothetical protein JL721_5137 [Aureococcus anophagefferens]|nr:hypothetical protein JL721_5137 [Aureococcus anophagefferens]
METNWVETDVLLSPQRARARGDDGGANDALRTVSKKRPRSVDGAHSTDAKRTHVVTPDDRFVPSIGVDARVLALAQSPDFSRVASVGSDEVLMICA